MPLTFNETERTITAFVPERTNQRCEFRWRPQTSTTWRQLADNGDHTEVWVVGPDAATIDVEARIVRRDGSTSDWAPFCTPVTVPVAAGGTGTAIHTERIFGSSTEDELTSNQMPLNSWTLNQVSAAGDAGIVRSGVEWNKELIESGFSADKEYGYEATRTYPATQTTGSVTDVWSVQLIAHWGVSSSGGEVTRREYNRRAVPSGVGSGRYQFYNGSTAINTWAGLENATRLVIDRKDRGGWPVLVLDFLLVDDRVVFEPKSSQWISFNITSITHGANQSTLTLSPVPGARTGGSDPSASRIVDFYFSEPEPPKPRVLGTAVYNASIRIARSRVPVGRMNHGWFDFYTSATSFTAATDIDQFGDVIKSAKSLQMYEQDEGRNEFTALAEVVIGNHIVLELDELNQWAAWEITSLNRANSIYTFGLKLVAYRVDRFGGATKTNYEQAADAVFGVTPYADPVGLSVRLQPINNVAIGTTSVPYTALITGPALVDNTNLTASVALIVTAGNEDPQRIEQGGTGDYSVTAPTISAVMNNTATATGTISLPGMITNQTRVLIGISVRKGNLGRHDNEFFFHVTSVAGAIVTTNDDTVYVNAASKPATPAPGGRDEEEFLPPGTSRTVPGLVAGQSIWQSTRVRRYTLIGGDPVFFSASNFGPYELFAENTLGLEIALSVPTTVSHGGTGDITITISPSSATFPTMLTVGVSAGSIPTADQSFTLPAGTVSKTITYTGPDIVGGATVTVSVIGFRNLVGRSATATFNVQGSPVGTLTANIVRAAGQWLWRTVIGGTQIGNLYIRTYDPVNSGYTRTNTNISPTRTPVKGILQAIAIRGQLLALAPKVAYEDTTLLSSDTSDIDFDLSTTNDYASPGDTVTVQLSNLTGVTSGQTRIFTTYRSAPVAPTVTGTGASRTITFTMQDQANDVELLVQVQNTQTGRTRSKQITVASRPNITGLTGEGYGPIVFRAGYPNVTWRLVLSGAATYYSSTIYAVCIESARSSSSAQVISRAQGTNKRYVSFTRTLLPSAPGTYVVNFYAVSGDNSVLLSSKTFRVAIGAPPITISGISAELSVGSSANLAAGGAIPAGSTYVWTASDGTIANNGRTAIYTPPNVTTPTAASVTLTITDPVGNIGQGSAGFLVTP